MRGSLSPVKVATGHFNGNLGGAIPVKPLSIKPLLQKLNSLDLMGNNPFYGFNGNQW